MQKKDFYRYNLIGSPLIMYNKLFIHIDFFKYFTALLFRKRVVRLNLNWLVKSSLTPFNFQYNEFFDYFSYFKPQIFKFKKIKHESFFFKHIYSFYFQQPIKLNDWRIKWFQVMWFFNKCLYLNKLNKVLLWNSNNINIFSYFFDLYNTLKYYYLNNIFFKFILYLKLKFLFLFRVYKPLNYSKLNLFFNINFYNKNLYNIRYLYLLNFILQSTWKLKFLKRDYLKKELYIYGQNLIKRNFLKYSYLRIKRLKKYPTLYIKNPVINYALRYRILRYTYQRKYRYKFRAYLFSFFKKFYFVVQKLINFKNINNFEIFEDYIYYFDLFSNLLKEFKFFWFDFKLRKKRYIKTIFYFNIEFFLEYFLVDNVPNKLKKKNYFIYRLFRKFKQLIKYSYRDFKFKYRQIFSKHKFNYDNSNKMIKYYYYYYNKYHGFVKSNLDCIVDLNKKLWMKSMYKKFYKLVFLRFKYFLLRLKNSKNFYNLFVPNVSVYFKWTKYYTIILRSYLENFIYYLKRNFQALKWKFRQFFFSRKKKLLIYPEHLRNYIKQGRWLYKKYNTPNKYYFRYYINGFYFLPRYYQILLIKWIYIFIYYRHSKYLLGFSSKFFTWRKKKKWNKAFYFNKFKFNNKVKFNNNI